MGAGASVFNLDKFTVTTHPVPDPGANCRVPIDSWYGSGGRVTAPDFLKIVDKGQDQLVVEGDQSVLLRDNQTVRIEKDRLHVITGNDTLVIGKNRKLKITGDYLREVQGAETSLNTGPTNRTFIDAVHEEHSEKREIDEPWHAESTGVAVEAIGLKIETVGLALELGLGVVAISLFKLDVGMVESEAKIGVNGTCIFDINTTGAKASVTASRVAIEAVKTGVSALRAHAGASVSGPPTSLGGN